MNITSRGIPFKLANFILKPMTRPHGKFYSVYFSLYHQVAKVWSTTYINVFD